MLGIFSPARRADGPTPPSAVCGPPGTAATDFFSRSAHEKAGAPSLLFETELVVLAAGCDGGAGAGSCPLVDDIVLPSLPALALIFPWCSCPGDEMETTELPLLGGAAAAPGAALEELELLDVAVPFFPGPPVNAGAAAPLDVELLDPLLVLP